MAVTLTPYDKRAYEEGRRIDVVGGQSDNSISVANGSVSDPIVVGGLYRVIATSDCVVRIGNATLANATGGEPWPEKHFEMRNIARGRVVAVDAA